MKAVFILFIFALCLCSHVLCSEREYLPGNYCIHTKRNTCNENCKKNGYTEGGTCYRENCYCAKPAA